VVFKVYPEVLVYKDFEELLVSKVSTGVPEFKVSMAVQVF